MGVDLIAEIKPGQNQKYDENIAYKFATAEFPVKHRIWKNWTEETENWPNDLKNFWWNLFAADDAQSIVLKIREYFPNDESLLEMARWLEYWSSKDAVFRLQEIASPTSFIPSTSSV